VTDIFDQFELMVSLGEDAKLCAELVEAFVEEYPKLMLEIHRAVVAHDAVPLARAAHSLKGALSHFAAQPAFDAVLCIEAISRNGNLHDVEEAYTKLDLEVARLA